MNAQVPQAFSLKDGRTALLRLAAVTDAGEFLTFLPQCIEESDMLNSMSGEFNKTLEEERAFLRAHTTKPGSTAVVVELGGRIVACAGAESKLFRRFRHHAECGLVVAKDYWRQGIGRALMEYLLAWARIRRLRKLTLCVYSDNVGAIDLYRSLGFVEEGRLREDAQRADGTYRDTVLMARHLV